MENNIISQMHNDEYCQIKFNSVIDYSQYINEIRMNTLNNEEEWYLNKEDLRNTTDEFFLTPSEIGMNIEGKKHLRIGACKRNVALNLLGSIAEDKKINVFETIERNNLIVEQWIKKFDYVGILKRLPEPEIKTIFGVKIKSYEKYIIDDPIRNREYILMIKPLNDTSYIVKEQIFINGKVMQIHIPEILINIFYHKKPVKLIYVGKNDTSIYKEYHFGIKDKNLIIDGVMTEHQIDYLINDAFQLQNMIQEKLIPDKDYIAEQIMQMKEISEMVKFDIVNNKAGNNLLQGNPYTSFQCVDCKYKNICEQLGDGVHQKTF